MTDKQYVAVFFVTQYNSSLSSFVPNFRILTQVFAEKSLTKFFTDIGEKEKLINKGTNKQCVAGFFFIHNTLPNFRILSQEVAEKSLTETRNVTVT